MPGKQIPLLAAIFCYLLNGNINECIAANYYFSSSTGNDAATILQAQSPGTPWKTLTKLNSFINTLQPGDSVLFKCGDTFYGSINITNSGNPGSPITFSSYGSGAKPIITGLTTLSTWASKGTNLWEASCPECGSKLNILLSNGNSKPMGRHPNYSALNNGYLYFESHSGNNQITDNELTNTPNWTGAELVIRNERWIIDRAPITNHLNGVIDFTPASQYIPLDKWGYFIQNHPSTLDQDGEWYYDPTSKTILFYNTGNITPLNTQVATLDYILTISNSQYLTFNNLNFIGSNVSTLNFQNCNFLKITTCDILYSGTNGCNGSNLKICSFENNVIGYTNNIGFNFTGNYISINGNTIKNTAVLPGIGKSGDGTYCAIQIGGNNNSLQLNTIDSTGYIPISFQGDSLLIKNNFITNFCFVKDDGGGIYTWNYCPNTPTGIYGIPHYNRKITNNIILNGIGAPDGTANLLYKPASGIYLDDNSMDVEIRNNSIANCANSGIFLHNSLSNVLNENTLFNNNTQLLFASGSNCANPPLMKNNLTFNNIFFSKLLSQKISTMSQLLAAGNSISQFGKFDSNYYCRPLNEENTIECENVNISNNIYNLNGWQNLYSMDLNSNKTAIQIPQYYVNSLVGNNKCNNGKFNADVAGLYCWSAMSNCSTTWDNSGILDGGSLNISFSSASGNTNRSLLVIGIGAIDSAKNYILKFSLKGTKNNQNLGVMLRKSQWTYANITPTQNFKISTSRTENEFLFSKPDSSESDASIQFEIDEADSTVWIDNIELYEANVTLTNPDDYIRFEYNATKSIKTITLSDSYIDVKNNPYSGSLTLQPFTSIILLKKFSPTTVNYLQRSNYDISVYPNPGSEFIMIELANPAQEGCRMELINMLGQKVLVENLQIGTFSRQINTGSLPTGAYTLFLSNNNNVAIKKVIIAR